MPINQQTKTAFVHIPRNGGTYIEHRMGVHKARPNSGFGENHNYSGDLQHLFGRNLQHLMFRDMLDLLGKSSIEFRWFAVIRNPEERFISILCHTMRCPDALNSFRALVTCLFMIMKTWIIFRLSNVRKGLFVLQNGQQISVYSPRIQHLMSQYEYIRTGKKKKTTIPGLTLFPFTELNNLHMFIPGLDESDPGNRIPNKSKEKPKSTNINLVVIRVFSRIFYRKDWALYKKVLEKWECTKQPVLIG